MAVSINPIVKSQNYGDLSLNGLFEDSKVLLCGSVNRHPTAIISNNIVHINDTISTKYINTSEIELGFDIIALSNSSNNTPNVINNWSDVMTSNYEFINNRVDALEDIISNAYLFNESVSNAAVTSYNISLNTSNLVFDEFSRLASDHSDQIQHLQDLQYSNATMFQLQIESLSNSLIHVTNELDIVKEIDVSAGLYASNQIVLIDTQLQIVDSNAYSAYLTSMYANGQAYWSSNQTNDLSVGLQRLTEIIYSTESIAIYASNIVNSSSSSNSLSNNDFIELRDDHDALHQLFNDQTIMNIKTQTRSVFASNVCAKLRTDLNDIQSTTVQQNNGFISTNLIADIIGIDIDTPIYPLHINTSDSNDISIWCKGQVQTMSDSNMKYNIERLSSFESLQKLNRINGYRYNSSKERKTLGVLAQEVQHEFPELVSKSHGILSVGYNGLIPIIIESIHALYQLIEEQDRHGCSPINKSSL